MKSRQERARRGGAVRARSAEAVFLGALVFAVNLTASKAAMAYVG